MIIIDIDTLRARAEQGDKRACEQLASRYRAAKNYEEAFKWYKAGENYKQLGWCYFYGSGVEQNIDEAIKCFKKGRCYKELGWCYIYGNGVEQNIDEAIKWYKAGGHYHDLGQCYYYGRGVEQNYKEAIKWFKEGKCYGMLGWCYFYGNGVEQNYKESVKYFTAADNKDMLGECYLHGLGVERNIDKTIELWEKACEERTRYYDVMLKLAYLYSDGIDMEPDYKKALDWWYQLAENDEGDFGLQGAFPEALYQIANYYYEGKGVKKNLKLALKHFRCTIDLFYENYKEGEIVYCERDREGYAIKHHYREIKNGITISDEPDFIIRSRKILVKHGCKSAINKIRKAAQNGDQKAASILKEFGVEIIVSKQPEPKLEKIDNKTDRIELPKRKPPIELNVGEVVTHKTFGTGAICEIDGDVVWVEFDSVGKKKFSNPEAFSGGYLNLARLI